MKVGSGLFWYLLALGDERRYNNRTRSTQLFAAEVGFGHVCLHRDCLLVAEGDSRHCPVILDGVRQGDNA